MTDITGFGLLGHLTEMCKGAKLSAEITYNNIPKIEAAINYAKSGIVPDATYRNWNAYANNIDIATTVDAMESFTLLPDPQTNGGLLIAVNQSDMKHLIAEAKKEHIDLTEIGFFTEFKNKEIFLV